MLSSPPALDENQTNTGPPNSDEDVHKNILHSSDDGVLEDVIQPVTYIYKNGAPYVRSVRYLPVKHYFDFSFAAVS